MTSNLSRGQSAAEQLFGIRRPQLIGESIDRFYKNSNQFQEAWQRFSPEVPAKRAELVKRDQSSVFVEFTPRLIAAGQHVMILRDVTNGAGPIVAP